PICEVCLRIEETQTIPDDCITRSIKADMEIWHRISSNQWLYALTQPVPATISCGADFENVAEINLHGVGILEMQPKCRCYTMSTSLVAAYNITRNHTNYVPPIDINLDDCCLEEQKILKVSKMDPIRIDDANLDELRHAKHRLEQF